MNKLTRQQAINAKCKDCIYDPLDKGTWLKQVESCTFSGCPLYPYRPLTKKSKPKRACISKAKLAHMAKMREAKKDG